MREEAKALVARMLSPDVRVRQEALAVIATADANVLNDLADLAASPDKPTAKAAKLAMERLVHAQLAPKNGKPDKKRQEATTAALTKIAMESPNVAVKRYAIELLGFAGDEASVRRLTDSPQTGADAARMMARIRSTRY